jgi:methylthioribose-1-phosphate isomerase
VVLTHCNAGALATAGYGTALGVIRSAFARNPALRVMADETRPLFQGARLTVWELMRDGIPVELITDNMAGYFMSKGLITHVVVGADRITANGDVANKIGTYTVSVLAREHGVPFFVAAPLSTVDLTLSDGSAIPIEERSPAEVIGFGTARWAPPGVKVRNPAFDVTPARNVSAIITERGVVLPPYGDHLRQIEARAR